MLLFVVLFIVFMLHIEFLLRFLLLGTDETTYFAFTARYPFDRAIAMQSLLFVLACMTVFALGYMFFYSRRKFDPPTTALYNLRPYRREIRLLSLLSGILLVVALILAFTTKLSYESIVEIKQQYSFIFQSRMIMLLLMAHLLLNIPLKQILTCREFRLLRWILGSYMLVTALLQVRSEFFEIAQIVAFSQLMWYRDKIKLKYVALLICALIVPNLIVLGRITIPRDPGVLIGGIFSFEYSTIFNNILSAAISNTHKLSDGLTFAPTLKLLVPSPLRMLFGIEVPPNTYYEDISLEANVFGGGFSFIAEMYSNFKWYAPLVFGGLGAMLGYMNARAARVGRVPLFYAAAPLLFGYFILAFRNDFGIFLKSSIQLLLIAFTLAILMRMRLIKRHPAI
jgi:hypothetical protein